MFNLPTIVQSEIKYLARHYGHQVNLELVTITLRESLPGAEVYKLPCKHCCGIVEVTASRRRIIMSEITRMLTSRPHRPVTPDDMRRGDEWWLRCVRLDAML